MALSAEEKRQLKIKFLNQVRMALNDCLRGVVRDGLDVNDRFLTPVRNFRRDVEQEIDILHEMGEQP